MTTPGKVWRVLVTARVPEIALKMLRETPGLEVSAWEGAGVMPRAELLARVGSGVDAIYCTLVDRIDAGVVAAAGGSLRVVSSMSVGFNHVDVGACRAAGVAVGHTPGVLTESVADHVVLLALAACRRVGEGARAVRDGSWGPWRADWLCGVDLHGATVGVVGLGRIGQAVARRLRGFDCRIVYTDEEEKAEAKELQAEFVGLDALLERADVVIPLVPLLESTRGLFDREKFARMKRSAVFVNAARGEIVDQEALYEALKERQIYAAALDVTTPEPLPTTSKLLELDNCLVLPHIASATKRTRDDMAALAAENLIAAFHGKPMTTPVR